MNKYKYVEDTSDLEHELLNPFKAQYKEWREEEEDGDDMDEIMAIFGGSSDE
jgi:hypothetical protein